MKRDMYDMTKKSPISDLFLRDVLITLSKLVPFPFVLKSLALFLPPVTNDVSVNLDDLRFHSAMESVCRPFYIYDNTNYHCYISYYGKMFGKPM